jgi:hypothetical protein
MVDPIIKPIYRYPFMLNPGLEKCGRKRSLFDAIGKNEIDEPSVTTPAVRQARPDPI